MSGSHLKRILLVASLVWLGDRVTKLIVLMTLGYAQQIDIVKGFFKLVHWGNTGAAWSLFYGNNKILAVVSLLALGALFLSHRHFDSHTALGQVALGLMLGGILGNLMDRVTIGHVIDFLYFYVRWHGREELGFPAFNVADTAICTGDGLIFLDSLRNEPRPTPPSTEKLTSD
jgi:signal peptidase II